MASKEKISFTADTLKIIGALRPNFDFKIGEEVEYRDGRLGVVFNTKNLTDYRVLVQPRKLWITSSPVTHPSKINNDIVLAQIDSFDLISDVEPNGAQGHRFYVDLPKKHKSKIYYMMSYEAKTDPVLVGLVKKYIESVISATLDELTTTKQFRYGEINISITNP